MSATKNNKKKNSPILASVPGEIKENMKMQNKQIKL